jgi:hypothetical protein
MEPRHDQACHGFECAARAGVQDRRLAAEDCEKARIERQALAKIDRRASLQRGNGERVPGIGVAFLRVRDAAGEFPFDRDRGREQREEHQHTAVTASACEWSRR